MALQPSTATLVQHSIERWLYRITGHPASVPHLLLLFFAREQDEVRWQKWLFP